MSNRYYDLEPPVSAGIEAAGLHVVRRIYTPTKAEGDGGGDASRTGWSPGGRASRTRSSGELTARGWSSPRVGEPLTDDFADLLRYLRVR